MIAWQMAVAFIIGAIMSGLAGLVGMKIATYSNTRVTNRARETRDLGETLKVAYRGGSVMGLCVGGFRQGWHHHRLLDFRTRHGSARGHRARRGDDELVGTAHDVHADAFDGAQLFHHRDVQLCRR